MGEGVWSNADTCGQGEGWGKGPCGRPQDGTFLDLFQHALQTLPMDDGYQYKLLFVLSDLLDRV